MAVRKNAYSGDSCLDTHRPLSHIGPEKAILPGKTVVIYLFNSMRLFIRHNLNLDKLNTLTYHQTIRYICF